MNFVVGEVWHWWCDTAGKKKYFLCVAWEGLFLFINKKDPKKRSFPSDLVFPNGVFHFLPPTVSGQSIVCCSTVVQCTPAEAARMRATLKGTITGEVLREILAFVETGKALVDEDREMIVEGLYDHLGI